MDPESQSQIKAVVDRFGNEDVVVVLGAADPEALEVAGETVTAEVVADDVVGRAAARGNLVQQLDRGLDPCSRRHASCR